MAEIIWHFLTFPSKETNLKIPSQYGKEVKRFPKCFLQNISLSAKTQI